MAKHPRHTHPNHTHHTHHINHTVKHHAINAAHVAFIQAAGNPARSSERQTGVPASVTIAQAILESAWGRHHMGAANNYFGVKAQTVNGEIVYGDIATGYVDRSTKEHIKKTNKDVTITAHFRSYSDMDSSFRDHGMFLRNNARYSDAIDAYAKTKDADEFARGLQKAGYATDPHYAELLISIMRKHNLYQYNVPVVSAPQGLEMRLP
jgi:flagellum-specific peptidoglycan hydrolase FlgJ